MTALYRAVADPFMYGESSPPGQGFDPAGIGKEYEGPMTPARERPAAGAGGAADDVPASADFTPD